VIASPEKPTPTKVKTISLYRAQYDFHHSPAAYKGFVAGIGSGKSFAGAYDLIRRAKAGSLYMMAAPTSKQLKDSSMRSLVELARDLGFYKDLDKSNLILTLGNGAEVLLRSMDDPDSARGPNLAGVWLDEATLMPHEAYTIAIGRLRQHGTQGWLSLTGTPKGRRHWTYKVFGPNEDGTPKKGVAVFTARTRDNPFLPPGFEDKLREQYTSALAAQELDAEWLDLEGSVANRGWFGIAPQKPKAVRSARFWDIAASVKNVHNEDPDYTVGALLSYVNMVYYVEDIVRGRWTPGEVESIIKRTAKQDGRRIVIGIEQEPGSAGKITGVNFVKMLAGYPVRLVRHTGDKLTRAMPFLAQAEHGAVKLIRGKWNDPFLDEVADFPVGVHDDQIDAAAGAFQMLTSHGSIGRIKVKIG